MLRRGHSRHQVRFRGFQRQVAVSGHQTIRLRLPIGFLAGFSQHLDEVLRVHVIQEIFSRRAPRRNTHVIHSPKILDAQLARHADLQDDALWVPKPIPFRRPNRAFTGVAAARQSAADFRVPGKECG